MTASTKLLTVGHGTATADELGERLRAAGVTLLVDVRIAPGSRRSPQFARDQLAGWLPVYGVSYRWERRLGGFRKLSGHSPDVELHNASFRGYAAWMRGEAFRAAMAELLSEAARERTAVMCSESVWWRCHRRLIADFATLVGGVDVVHLMPDGSRRPHQPTRGVRVAGDALVYDVQSG